MLEDDDKEELPEKEECCFNCCAAVWLLCRGKLVAVCGGGAEYR